MKCSEDMHRFQTFHMPMQVVASAFLDLGIPAFCLGHRARCIGNWVQVVMHDYGTGCHYDRPWLVSWRVGTAIITPRRARSK